MKSKITEEFIIISGEKELIEEFKENFKINTEQTGEESLILNEINFKKLKKEWIKRIQDRGGIIYKYMQKEMIDSFIKDIRGY